MSELLELAERLEREPKASRELDILIGCAIGLKGDDEFLSFRKSFEVVGMDDMLRMAESHQNIWRTELPRYTGSIDAAMTLVPEGIAWMIGCAPGEGFFATLSTTDEAIERGDPDISVDNIIAKTPALALCAASIRAIDGARG